ncbi:hypothetical protein M514_08099, partial [Trichuris suis]
MSSSTAEGNGTDAQTSEQLDAWNCWHSAFKSVHHRKANKQDITRAPLTIRRLHWQLFGQHKLGKGEKRSFKLKSAASVPKALLAKPVRRYLHEEMIQSPSTSLQSVTTATAASVSSNEFPTKALHEEGAHFESSNGEYEKEEVIFPFEASYKDDTLSRYSSLSRICFQCSNEEENELPNSDSCVDQVQPSSIEEDVETTITKVRRKARSNDNYRRLQLKKKKYVVEQKKKKKISTTVRLRKWQGSYAIY